MAQTRFKVGNSVRWTGIAGRLFGDTIAVVVEVIPNKDGVELMDQYAVRGANGESGIYYSAELEAVTYPTAHVGHILKLSQ